MRSTCFSANAVPPVTPNSILSSFGTLVLAHPGFDERAKLAALEAKYENPLELLQEVIDLVLERHFGKHANGLSVLESRFQGFHIQRGR